MTRAGRRSGAGRGTCSCCPPRSPKKLAETVRAQVEAEPRARLEYANVIDAETMEKLDRISDDRPALIALAARVGGTRLIDNILLQPAKQKSRDGSGG